MGGVVKSVFGSPNMSAPPPPPPPPTTDDAAAMQSRNDEARRRRGSQASILTSPEGVGSAPVGTKTLLGS
jgi:hypothetical protein